MFITAQLHLLITVSAHLCVFLSYIFVCVYVYMCIHICAYISMYVLILHTHYNRTYVRTSMPLCVCVLGESLGHSKGRVR